MFLSFTIIVTTNMAQTLKQKCEADRKNEKIQDLQDRQVQKQSFNELLVLQHANSGKLLYGEVANVIYDYSNRGFLAITIQNRYYWFECLLKRGVALLS
jgi:hypothetical protein